MGALYSLIEMRSNDTHRHCFLNHRVDHDAIPFYSTSTMDEPLLCPVLWQQPALSQGQEEPRRRKLAPEVQQLVLVPEVRVVLDEHLSPCPVAIVEHAFAAAVLICQVSVAKTQKK